MSGLLPALGGGANSVVQLVAGGLSGVLGMSALIATGVVAPASPPAGPQSLVVVGCPGSGSVMAVARPGEQMLITGRSADGAWFRVYVPGPANNDGWVPAGTVDLLADASGLPVVGCAVSTVPGTPGPTAVPATATPTGTAVPTATPKPTPTSTPTSTPNPGPVLANLKASRGTIYADRSGHCVGSPASLAISVTATDADGVKSVTLYWRPAGSSTYRAKAMAASGNQWTATLSTHSSGDHLTAKGTVAYYVVATDAAGSQSRSPTTSKSFKVALCNHPPAVGNMDFGGSEVYAPDPPYCADSFGVYLSGVIDPDGDAISSVLFWYKAYGMTAYRSARLSGDPGVPGFYSGTVTNAKWPPMPGPPYTYSIPWYFTATDSLGATTKYSNAGFVLTETYCLT